MKFGELEYHRPDVARIREDYRELVERIERAETEEKILDIWEVHQRLGRKYNLPDRTVYIHNTMNVKDEFYAGEEAYFDNISPECYNAMDQLYKALLEYPKKQVLADKFGKIILGKIQVALNAADESVINLQRESDVLVGECDKLYASYMVNFQGKQVTLPQLAVYIVDDRGAATCRAMHGTDGKWSNAHHEKLDDIFSHMIQNHSEQAHRMSSRDYSELSYLRIGRIGYDMKDIENYREQATYDIVPVAK